MAEALLYEIRCIFCKRIHRSFFFDEIEEQILACRDRAAEWQKGRLDTWENPTITPITVESAALCGDMDSTAVAGGP